jgi:hypothetical protein
MTDAVPLDTTISTIRGEWELREALGQPGDLVQA